MRTSKIALAGAVRPRASIYKRGEAPLFRFAHNAFQTARLDHACRKARAFVIIRPADPTEGMWSYRPGTDAPDGWQVWKCYVKIGRIWRGETTESDDHESPPTAQAVIDALLEDRLYARDPVLCRIVRRESVRGERTKPGRPQAPKKATG